METPIPSEVSQEWKNEHPRVLTIKLELINQHSCAHTIVKLKGNQAGGRGEEGWINSHQRAQCTLSGLITLIQTVQKQFM